MNQCFEARLARAIALRISEEYGLGKVSTIEVKYGLEVLFQLIVKLSFIYSTALILHSFIETIVFHITFFIMRIFVGSTHSKTSLGCTFWTIALVIIVGLTPSNIKISLELFLLVFVTGVSVILKYSIKKENSLMSSILFTALLLFCCSFSFALVSKSIFIGIISSIVVLIPKVKKMTGMVV